MAYDARDRDMRPRSRPRLCDIAGQTPPIAPLFAYVKSPVWDQADALTGEAFAELAEALREYKQGSASGGTTSLGDLLKEQLEQES